MSYDYLIGMERARQDAFRLKVIRLLHRSVDGVCAACGETSPCRTINSASNPLFEGYSGLTGAELIAEERQRQIDAEGYSASYDSNHSAQQLAMAAACYATPPHHRLYREPRSTPALWPWNDYNWKPTPDDRVRELVKAGALIAAEIDRLWASGEPCGVCQGHGCPQPEGCP